MKRLGMLIFIVLFSSATTGAFFKSVRSKFVSKEYVYQVKKCGGFLFDVVSELGLSIFGFGYAYYCFDRYNQKSEENVSHFKWLGIMGFLTAFKGLRLASISYSKLAKSFRKIQTIKINKAHYNKNKKKNSSSILIPSSYVKKTIKINN